MEEALAIAAAERADKEKAEAIAAEEKKKREKAEAMAAAERAEKEKERAEKEKERAEKEKAEAERDEAIKKVVVLNKTVANLQGKGKEKAESSEGSSSHGSAHVRLCSGRMTSKTGKRRL